MCYCCPFSGFLCSVNVGIIQVVVIVVIVLVLVLVHVVLSVGAVVMHTYTNYTKLP